MTDHDAFLVALEANPGDDFAWLVYADWLEEQGEALAGVLRGAIESRLWTHWTWRQELFRPLDQRRLQLLACDCVERVLPILERLYPDDRRFREFLEALRCDPTGPRFVAAREAFWRAIGRVGYPTNPKRDSVRMGPAKEVARLAELILTNPTHACLNTPFAAVYGRFGFEAHRASSSQYKPEWQAVRDAEIRWQVARLLRYHFGFLGGGPSSSSGP